MNIRDLILVNANNDFEIWTFKLDEAIYSYVAKNHKTQIYTSNNEIVTQWEFPAFISMRPEVLDSLVAAIMVKGTKTTSYDIDMRL
jgi:hypothetical protein